MLSYAWEHSTSSVSLKCVLHQRPEGYKSVTMKRLGGQCDETWFQELKKSFTMVLQQVLVDKHKFCTLWVTIITEQEEKILKAGIHVFEVDMMGGETTRGKMINKAKFDSGGCFPSCQSSSPDS